MSNPNGLEKLSGAFQALITNPEQIFQFLEMFPNPIQVFAPDGLLVFSNQAFLDWNNIPDASLIVGKYNLLNDPVCNELDWMREGIQSAFKGQAVATSDFKPPIEDFVNRSVIEEKPYESAFMDTYLYPVWNGDKLAYVVNTFIIKDIFKGRADIAKAQEYIKQHWQDEFDLDKVAQSANLSHRHFQRIFKEVTGVTPIDYYQNLKIEKIQEKLLDNSLSIEQAFAACGVGAHGTYFRLFKEKTKKTPSEYRKENRGKSNHSEEDQNE